MVRDAAVEDKKNTRTIKVSVKKLGGIRRTRKFMGMLGGNT